jgi:hypothetical protein
LPGSGDDDPGKTVSRYRGEVKHKLDCRRRAVFIAGPSGNEKVRASLCDLCASAVKSALASPF